VAYDFQHDLARLRAQWPGAEFIGGGTSTKAALDIESRWNRGLVPLLFGHPQSMGHGLNLQKSHAHNICWFTTTWDFELYDQFNRRLRRSGNKAPQVNVYHLVARDTIDQSVVLRLREKKRTQDLLFEALKERRAQRSTSAQPRLQLSFPPP
jgi:SNF2 family DNA or RNA helicase